jgi:hypothetical protein
MKNKPYDKEKSISSLGSDLTTTIQNFHYAGEMVEKKDIEKIQKDRK